MEIRGELMQYLHFYKSRELYTEEDVFKYFINSLKESIFTWDYFVDFSKVIYNTNTIKKELLILNSLLGLRDQEIDTAFEDLIRNHPCTRKALPILIASRMSKISITPIIDDLSKMIATNKKDIFSPKVHINDEIMNDLQLFFSKTGLRQFFIDKEVSNLLDYCKGIEVGMDTNARKNRTGTNMENILENYLAGICSNNNFKYLVQATKSKIQNEWNINIEVDKIERRFDFALLSPDRRLSLIEVNYYSGGGSKLKATAGEYKSLQDFLVKQGITFIWVTDGDGWKTAKTALYETFLANDFTFNLEMISNGILKEILI